MAVQPQHVREAHFALTDTPLTFFVALTLLLLALRAPRTDRLRWFFLAGAAAGLAPPRNTTARWRFVMPLVAVLSSSARGCASIAVLGRHRSAPLVGLPRRARRTRCIDLPGFLNGFASLMQHYNQERHGLESSASVYVKHIADWFSVSEPGGRHYRFTAWPAVAL